MTKRNETRARQAEAVDNSGSQASSRTKNSAAHARKAKSVDVDGDRLGGLPGTSERRDASRSGKARIETVMPFNPLGKEVLGGAIAQVLLTTRVYPLNEELPLRGAGIYALYYSGDFPAYAGISRRNRNGRFELPIYVGQALPAGGRTGLKVTAESLALRRRLSKHRSSIEAAGRANDGNLDIKDFHYRALVLDDTFIRLGESSLIALFAPVWNVVVPGFGNNAPGKDRNSMKSRWDSLHPGRKQAERHPARDETLAQIEAEIRRALREQRPKRDQTLISAKAQSVFAGLSSANLDRVENADAAGSDLGADEKDDAADAE